MTPQRARGVGEHEARFGAVEQLCRALGQAVQELDDVEVLDHRGASSAKVCTMCCSLRGAGAER